MLKQNYLEIFKTFFVALVFLIIGSVIGVTLIPPSIRNFLNLAFFILIIFSLFSRRGGFIDTKVKMYCYSFILGILTGSTYIYYLNILGVEVFFFCILGIGVFFGVSYMIALNTSESKLTGFMPMIWAAIISLSILEFINIFFFKFGTYDLILSLAGILIYSAYSVYIMKSIQVRCRYGLLPESEIVALAYSVFISFLNLLLDLLRLVSILKDDI